MSKLSMNMGHLKKHELHIPFEELSSATNRFNEENIIGKGGYGSVYKGISEKHGCIAVKRLDPRHGQGYRQFRMEITFLSKYKHENIASLLGFCVDLGEKMLVYKFESNRSLDKHLRKQDLTWIQRLQICLGAARGIAYLHDDNAGFRSGIYHRDVKSSNILLDDKWTPKISDFGLSREGSMDTFVISNPCGTAEYIDPDYMNAGYLTKKSDVYSFGVVLWEVVCGRPAYPTSHKYNRPSLIKLVERCYTRNTLEKIIPSYIYKQINQVTLSIFTNTAYQCLKNAEERPTMKEVVEQLQLTLQNQQVVVSQEMTKPKEEGKKANEEAKEPKEGKKDAISTEKNGTKSNDLPPALSPSQEVVLKVSVHCQGCAERLQKCLKKVTGVEKVIAKCETDKVIVKGNIANPSELVKSVHNEFKWRNVEVIPPPTHEPEKSRKMIKKSEQEEPDNVPVSVITMQCDACAPDTKNNIIKTEVPDQHISQVEIIGTGDDKTGNNTVIVNQDSPQTQGRKIEMTGDDNPTTNVNGPDPGPLEENQWLCALKTFVSFVVYVLFACYLVLMTLGYLGKRVHRMVMQIYDIPVPQSDDRPLPQDSQSPQQSPP